VRCCKDYVGLRCNKPDRLVERNGRRQDCGRVINAPRALPMATKAGKRPMTAAGVGFNLCMLAWHACRPGRRGAPSAGIPSSFGVLRFTVAIQPLSSYAKRTEGRTESCTWRRGWRSTLPEVYGILHGEQPWSQPCLLPRQGAGRSFRSRLKGMCEWQPRMC
jgi:hypothetical protein